MTTTVCDLVNKIITADTRWSAIAKLSDGNVYLSYCDDTGFDKISVVGLSAIILAGHGRLIADWKRWWEGSADPSNRPQHDIDGVNQVNLAIVDLKHNSVIFDAGHKTVLYCTASNDIKAFTSGSGGVHAASDLLTNECAKNAVSVASTLDCRTSNIVKFACYKTGQDNLNKCPSDYNVIKTGIMQRGRIVKVQDAMNAKSIPINDHHLGDEMVSLIGNGDAVASAPVPGMSKFKWTKETDENFKSAMERVHELRK